MELRRSPLRWWLPPLIAVYLLFLFGRSRGWVGVWPQTSAAAQVPMILLTPALAAGAAWSASRTARNRAEEQLSALPRPGWAVDGVHLLAIVLLGLVPLAVGAASAFAVTYAESGAGWIWPEYLVLAVAVLVISVSMGQLAGRLLPWRITPVLVGVVNYLGLAALDNTALELFVLSGPPSEEVSWRALAARLAVAAALVTVALVAPELLRATPSVRVDWSVTALGAAVVVLVSALAVQLNGERLMRERTPVVATCAGSEPEVCLWPENQKYLAEAVSMTQRLAAAVRGLSEVPTTVYEEGLRPGQNRAGLVTVGSGDSAFAYSLAGAFPLGEVQQCPDDERNQAFETLLVWRASRAVGNGRPLPMSPGHSGPVLDDVQRVLRMDEDGQRRWLTESMSMLRRPCGT
ncbi:hypothetical protein [Plantactinospora sp. KLBMP9567]|uniref:DUF7224 domain-containing protein n=1 Tax=Plantactinospora sp. KLBMP9567 TaxID=3085900 RepID=UPI0029821CA3|nr:hypothetical protein [Plantactinospora sp. KLBMP9567]MDW5327625.1 hypothetical protein [Plantactinospora sp. KLBMP9567]